MREKKGNRDRGMPKGGIRVRSILNRIERKGIERNRLLEIAPDCRVKKNATIALLRRVPCWDLRRSAGTRSLLLLSTGAFPARRFHPLLFSTSSPFYATKNERCTACMPYSVPFPHAAHLLDLCAAVRAQQGTVHRSFGLHG